MKSVSALNKTAGILLVAVFCVYAASLFIGEVGDTDTWFHLKTGEYIVKNISLPATDPYSYTAAGHKYVDSQWLFQVFLYVFYSTAGIAGIFAFQVIILSLAFYFLLKNAYRKNKLVIAVFAAVFSLIAGSSRFTPRPEMFTILFIPLYLFLLEKYRDKSGRMLYFIPLLQILWTNMHGLFLLGPVIIWIYALSEYISERINLKFIYRHNSESKKYARLFNVGLLALLACLATPYGIEGVSYPFLLISEVGEKADIWMKTVGELQPPLSLSAGTSAITTYKVIISIALASFILNIRKIRLSYLALTLLFLYLSMIAQRNIALFALVSGIFIAFNLNSFIETYRMERNVNLFSLFSIILSLALVFFCVKTVSHRYYISHGLLFKRGYDFKTCIFQTVPDKAVDFIIDNDLKGNIFNDNTIGGYLLWRFYPGRKVFVDGRWEVYGRKFMEAYKLSLTDMNAFRAMLDNFNVDYIIMSFDSLESKRLAEPVYKSGDWALVYIDDTAAIYLKRVEKFLPFIKEHEVNLNSYREKYYSDDHNRFLNTSILFEKGKFLYSIGRYELSVLEYEKVIERDPLYYGAYTNIGNAYMQEKIFDRAVEYYNKSLALKSDYYESLYNLAYLYMISGAAEDSIKFFGRALSVKKDSVEARYNLALVYFRKGEMQEAKKQFEEVLKYSPDNFDAHMRLAALYEKEDISRTINHLLEMARIRPDFPLAYYNLGSAFYRTGDRERAKEMWEKFLKLSPNSKEAGIVKRIMQ